MSQCQHIGKHPVTRDGQMYCGTCETWVQLEPAVVAAIAEAEAHQDDPDYWITLEELDRERAARDAAP